MSETIKALRRMMNSKCGCFRESRGIFDNAIRLFRRQKKECDRKDELLRELTGFAKEIITTYHHNRVVEIRKLIEQSERELEPDRSKK